MSKINLEAKIAELDAMIADLMPAAKAVASGSKLPTHADRAKLFCEYVARRTELENMLETM